MPNRTTPERAAHRLAELEQLNLAMATDMRLTNLWIELDNLIDAMKVPEFRGSDLPGRAERLQQQVATEQQQRPI